MARKKTRHHLIPKCRKKDYKTRKVVATQITLRLWDEKHKAWHELFGLMTLDEIIKVLLRIRRIKFGKPPFRQGLPL